MKHVTLTRAAYDFDTDTPYDETVAVFNVDADGIHIESGEEFIPTDISVFDVQHKRDVSLADDPERWAELLPSAYRAGDYSVVVSDHAQTEEQIVTAVGVAAAVTVAGIDVLQAV